jgi:hypothetical protein
VPKPNDDAGYAAPFDNRQFFFCRQNGGQSVVSELDPEKR